MAGRGFGKTRAGAEWVRNIAETNCNARIALVSASLSEARAVMVEGESGIIACSPPDRAPVFEASLRRLRWPNGAQAQLFSAAEPESLRGPQHSHACRTGSKRILHQSSVCDDRWYNPIRC
ncbi:terminase large subunit domain-containing protein [Erythrobacter crassostreae]